MCGAATSQCIYEEAAQHTSDSINQTVPFGILLRYGEHLSAKLGVQASGYIIAKHERFVNLLEQTLVFRHKDSNKRSSHCVETRLSCFIVTQSGGLPEERTPPKDHRHERWLS